MTVVIDQEPTTAEHVSSFLSGTVFSASGMAVSGVLTMLTGIIFARWLKPEGFGIYSNVVAVVTFGAGFGAVGMDFTVARYVCYYLGTGDKHLIRTVIRYGARWGLIVSAVVGSAIFILLRGGLLNGTKLAGLAPFSLLLLLAIPALALQSVVFQAILSLQAVKTRVILEKVLHPLLRLALPFALLWCFHEKIRAAVGGILLAALVLTVTGLMVLRGCLRGVPPAVAPPREVSREWSAFALPYVFFSIQTFISAGMGIDIVLVGALVSMSDSGIYAACFRFVLVLLLARAGMDYAFGPKVGRLYGKSDMESIGRLYKTSSAVGLAWTLPFSVVLVLFSHPLMARFFGPSYARGGTALALLVAGFAADGGAGCNTTLLSMIGKPWLVLTNGLVGGVVAVSLCLLLIPRFGMSGAALAVSLARCIAAGMGTFEIWHIHDLHPFSRSLGKLLLAAGLAGILGFAWKQQLQVATTQSFLVLAVGVAVVFSGYILVLWLSRFSIQGLVNEG
jgi:O-antigen/teichoic acid export membrane protein